MFSSINPSVYSSIQLTVTSDQDLILNLILIKYSWKVECSWYPPSQKKWVGLPADRIMGNPAHIAWVNSHIFQHVLNFFGLRSSSSSSPDDKNHHLSSMRRTSWVFHIYHPIYHPIYHHLSPEITCPEKTSWFFWPWVARCLRPEAVVGIPQSGEEILLNDGCAATQLHRSLFSC